MRLRSLLSLVFVHPQTAQCLKAYQTSRTALSSCLPSRSRPKLSRSRQRPLAPTSVKRSHRHPRLHPEHIISATAITLPVRNRSLHHLAMDQTIQSSSMMLATYGLLNSMRVMLLKDSTYARKRYMALTLLQQHSRHTSKFLSSDRHTIRTAHGGSQQHRLFEMNHWWLDILLKAYGQHFYVAAELCVPRLSFYLTLTISTVSVCLSSNCTDVSLQYIHLCYAERPH